MFSSKGRIVAVISIMMAIIMSLGAAAAPVVTDITKDHWAYEAVMSLVEKGYLGVYNDGSFKGDEPVSRYLLAFVVSKMLTDLEKGTVTATEEDMGVLREVANELRGEMVPLLAALDTRVKELEKAELEAGKSLTAERQERKAEAAGILDDLEDQAERIVAMDKSLETTEKGLAALMVAMQEEAAAERKLIDSLKKQGDESKAETGLALKGLESAQAKTDAVISGLSVELETLKAVMSDDIDKSVTELSNYLEAEIASRKALETRVGTLEDETAEDLASAVASLREWASAEHAAMAAGFDADLKVCRGKLGQIAAGAGCRAQQGYGR